MDKLTNLLSENVDDSSWDEELICRLQAYIRAFLTRKQFQEVRSLYKEIVREVEGDILLGNQTNVSWRTHLPCRPRCSPKLRKCFAVVKDGTKTTQTCLTPSGQRPVEGADQDVKSQGTDLDSRSHQEEIPFEADGKELSGLGGECQDPVHQVHAETLPSCEGEGLPELDKVLVNQGQSLTPSEEGNESVDFHDSTRRLESVSERSSKHSKQGSPSTSVDYTLDFESCSSSATSEAARLISTSTQLKLQQDSGNAASLELCVVALAGDKTAVTEGNLPNGNQVSEVTSDKMDEKQMEKRENDWNSAEDFTPVQSSGTNTISQPNLQRLDRKSPDDCIHVDGMVSSTRDEVRTFSPEGDEEAMSVSQEEASKSGGSSDAKDSLKVAPSKMQDLTEESRGDLNVHVASNTLTDCQDQVNRNSNQDQANGKSKMESVPTPPHPPNVSDEGKAAAESTMHGSRDEEEEGGGLGPATREMQEARETTRLASEKRSYEQDFSIAADMTSIWSNENSFTEMPDSDYPIDLRELQRLRNSVALELLWVQQAIASRKNYLRLKSNMEPPGQQRAENL
ncbi:uncharacterized protein LOC110979537 [Acanthaster planci]|uniref:Uncharacterized protein LOC110979537 n=1 Tax=Acanthaster planci TaxID=133434 RepID=A0A8B7YEU4_ACAPL|nr:uncharacterized protein LOC110979537 [Acanthaster planci]